MNPGAPFLLKLLPPGGYRSAAAVLLLGVPVPAGADSGGDGPPHTGAEQPSRPAQGDVKFAEFTRIWNFLAGSGQNGPDPKPGLGLTSLNTVHE